MYDSELRPDPNSEGRTRPSTASEEQPQTAGGFKTPGGLTIQSVKPIEGGFVANVRANNGESDQITVVGTPKAIADIDLNTAIIDAVIAVNKTLQSYQGCGNGNPPPVIGVCPPPPPQ